MHVSYCCSVEMESLVKQVNLRVKRTEMFWNDATRGGESILQSATTFKVPATGISLCYEEWTFMSVKLPSDKNVQPPFPCDSIGNGRMAVTKRNHQA